MSEALDFLSGTELRHDLVEIGAGVFKTALHRVVHTTDANTLDEKPVDLVKLKIYRNMPVGGASVVTAEVLEVGFDRTSEAPSHTSRPWYENLSPGEITDYQESGQMIGKLLLGGDWNAGKGITADNANVGYRVFSKRSLNSVTDTAGKDGEQERTVGKYIDQSDETVIASAKIFAEEAFDYVESEDFIVDNFTQMSRAIDFGAEMPSSGIKHKFVIIKDPSMPISGREPKQFINEYMLTMKEKWIMTRQLITAAHEKGDTTEINAHEATAIRYKHAVERALKWL